MSSFIYLLLEETRADLFSHLAQISQASASLISGLQRIALDSHKQLFYHLTLNGMKYDPAVGDLIALTQVKPKCIDDLAQSNTFFFPAYVTKVIHETPIRVQILSSQLIESNPYEIKGFVVYLTNLTTNLCIWQSFDLADNENIIQRTLSFSSSVEPGDKCCADEENGVIDLKLRQSFDSFNTSQEAAVLSCLATKKCYHENSFIKLIWGPPGTGKTKTVASLLFVLLRTKHRTLTCAPTNIAVVGVAKRLLSLLRDHDLGCDTYGFGDIVLFGNKERMKITVDHKELLDVFLDNRINVLRNCLSLWKTLTGDMIRFLENPVKEHQCFIVPMTTKTKSKKEKEQKRDENDEQKPLTFEEFVLSRFSVLGKKFVTCIRDLYTHLPTSVLPLSFAKKMNHSIDLVQKVGESVQEIVTRNHSLKKAFGNRVNRSHFIKLRLCKTECLQALNDLRTTSFIPNSMNMFKLKNFCLSNACLLFCTASSSIKLCRKGMAPIEMVLIDEAAQLKECESLILLQLSGVRNAVLVGDERQLPPMVQSKEAKFGRSLFERLVLLGHQKHLLNVQYRMHPSISQIPNAEFYNGQILDGPSVIDKTRDKLFLQEDMYGSYSFINVDYAKEEHDKNYSTRTHVGSCCDCADSCKYFQRKYEHSFMTESTSKKQKVTVGCISPYKAQVDAIQAKLGTKYNQQGNGWSFYVNIRSVDGFQGSEEDMIIFSIVICNHRRSIGFLSSRERANVALTRARNCLLIVGNKETMIKSGSIWNALVYDAENHGCVFDAHEDKNLAQVMVNFTNTFLERISGVRNLNVRKLVVSLLVKLSSGWRQVKTSKRNSYNDKRGMLNMFEIYNVNGDLCLLWSVDIVYENSLCVEILKFWDILRLSQIQQRAKRLESAFGNYTLEMISRCQTKLLESDLVLPMTWVVDSARDSTLVLTSHLAKLSLKDQTRKK